MKAISILYGGRLEPEALESLSGQAQSAAGAIDSCSVLKALEAARSFQGVEKTVFLGIEGWYKPVLKNIDTVFRPSWTVKSLLDCLSRESAGYDLLYFAWADCPLLDPALAAALAERHLRYSAEYSYADGWPYGFAPELLAPGTAGILYKILGENDGPVERDTLFEVLKKDINAFDIETEISPVDLRPYRFTLAADSRRNLLLLSRMIEAGYTSASAAEAFIREKPEMLRTLPAFFSILVSGDCPQACPLCPWPKFGSSSANNSNAGDAGASSGALAPGKWMPKAAFGELLDKIVDFAGDGVIDLSLWGELALHPEKLDLIQMVFDRPALSLIIETSGIGWTRPELEDIAKAASLASPRKNHMPPVSWIVSLDAFDPVRYREVRGAGYGEAKTCAKTLLSLFPGNAGRDSHGDAYVQAIRVKGSEDDIESFYRSWKGDELPIPASGVIPARWTNGSHIIIQKYDDFAGSLPKLQASDLSPVKRRPCWHILRDMNILLDGTVVSCREDLGALAGKGDKPALGNVFSDGLDLIWQKGAALYREHCVPEYKGICADCDEYYTYNF